MDARVGAERSTLKAQSAVTGLFTPPPVVQAFQPYW